MADLLPAHAQCVTGLVYASTVTDAPLFFTRIPMEIHYIDIIAVDSADAITGGTVTLEYEAEATGDDTTIDAITIASWDTETAHADITQPIVPAGQRVMATVATVADVATNLLVVQCWYVPLVAG